MTASQIPLKNFNYFNIPNFDQLTAQDTISIANNMAAYRNARQEEAQLAIRALNLPFIKDYARFDSIATLRGLGGFSFEKGNQKEIDMFEYLLSFESEEAKIQWLQHSFLTALKNIKHQVLPKGKETLEYLLATYPGVKTFWPSALDMLDVLNYEYIQKNYYPALTPKDLLQHYNFNYHHYVKEEELWKAYEIFKEEFKNDSDLAERFLISCFVQSKPKLFDKVMQETRPDLSFKELFKKMSTLHLSSMRDYMENIQEPMYIYLIKNKEVISKCLSSFIFVSAPRLETLLSIHQENKSFTKGIISQLSKYYKALGSEQRIVYEKYALLHDFKKLDSLAVSPMVIKPPRKNKI